MTAGATPLWRAVRRAVLDLQWSEQRTHDLLGQWQQTLTALLEVRRSLGPVPVDDPVVLAASAAAAARRGEPAPVEATSLEAVQAALAVVAHTAIGWPDEQRAGLADPSLRAAYELAHWVRIRHPSDAVRQWLEVGESALDQELYTLLPRSATRVGLARWQVALADVHALQDNPVVQRGVALAHDLVLEAAERALQAVAASDGLPEPVVQHLHDGLAQVRRGHHATLSELAGLRAVSQPANLTATRKEQGPRPPITGTVPCMATLQRATLTINTRPSRSQTRAGTSTRWDATLKSYTNPQAGDSGIGQHGKPRVYAGPERPAVPSGRVRGFSPRTLIAKIRTELDDLAPPRRLASTQTHPNAADGVRIETWPAYCRRSTLVSWGRASTGVTGGSTSRNMD